MPKIKIGHMTIYPVCTRCYRNIRGKYYIKRSSTRWYHISCWIKNLLPFVD